MSAIVSWNCAIGCCAKDCAPTRPPALAYAQSIRHIADIYRQEGDSREAKSLYEEALELYRSDLNTKLLDPANTVRPYALLLEEEGYSAPARRATRVTALRI